MKDGFVRVAAACPEIRVADCLFNSARITEAVAEAARRGASLVVFPELCITSYTCGDLFLQSSLRTDALRALEKITDATAAAEALVCVGLPLAVGNALYNTAAFLHRGKIVAIVPKTYLPNYADYYELRHFRGAPAGEAAGAVSGVNASPGNTIRVSGAFPRVPFGTDILIRDSAQHGFTVAAEICEDLWVPQSPSVCHALAGATVIANLSASIEGIGKGDFRRRLVLSHSQKLCAAYVYSGASWEESTTDVIYGGHSLIAENGELLAESRRFQDRITVADVDVEALVQERLRTTTFALCEAKTLGSGTAGYRIIDLEISAPAAGIGYTKNNGAKKDSDLLRPVNRFPFVPEDKNERERACDEAIMLQSQGLARRLAHTKARASVIGISGGLDSTLALLVTVEAWGILGKKAENAGRIIAVTLPCFGTTGRTKDNAAILCAELGVPLREISIEKAVRGHLADIGHEDAAFDAAFENAQARERTQVLMDIANMKNALVVGTGDLSELALGWATYNGDQMSMYGVNATIPKTLVKAIVEHYANRTAAEKPVLARVLRDILATPISPELLPPGQGVITQITEDTIGPYELHDFFLYNGIRKGFCPSKVRFLAKRAFDGVYDDETITRWLRVFYQRFFAQQYKRSPMPDGGKAGSFSLSPRGEWRMPSDATCTAWLRELEGTPGRESTPEKEGSHA